MAEEKSIQSKNTDERLLGLMEDLQAKTSYLSEENLRKVARELDMSLSRVYSVATFYKAFSLKPKGKHRVCVCVGTACHVRGADRIVEKIAMDLNISPGGTTGDGNFSLETLNCIGACALGPVVVVDGESYGKVASSEIEKILDKYRNK